MADVEQRVRLLMMASGAYTLSEIDEAAKALAAEVAAVANADMRADLDTAKARIAELEEQLEGARRWIGSVVKLGASKADRIQAVLATTPSSTGERRE